MTGYLIRRTGTSIIILFGISLGVFFLIHVIYPSPAADVLGLRAGPIETRAWNRANGFDQPWVEQWARYVWRCLHGNFGYSFKLNQSVVALFGERWMRSAYLTGTSLVLAVLIAIPLGIYQAVRRNSVGDNVVTSAAFVLYAMPDFFFYFIIIGTFALAVPIFSFEGSQYTSIWQIMADWHAMTLPIFGYALLVVAGYSRYMRSAGIDTLALDYIKAARAKGLPERLVLSRHLLRNACLPMISLIGLSIPLLLSGNLIEESVFNYPGLGLLFFDSLQNEDYPVLLGLTMIGAVLVVAGNYAADIALCAADPRIRLA